MLFNIWCYQFVLTELHSVLGFGKGLRIENYILYSNKWSKICVLQENCYMTELEISIILM